MLAAWYSVPSTWPVKPGMGLEVGRQGRVGPPEAGLVMRFTDGEDEGAQVQRDHCGYPPGFSSHTYLTTSSRGLQPPAAHTTSRAMASTLPVTLADCFMACRYISRSSNWVYTWGPITRCLWFLHLVPKSRFPLLMFSNRQLLLEPRIWDHNFIRTDKLCAKYYLKIF